MFLEREAGAELDAARVVRRTGQLAEVGVRLCSGDVVERRPGIDGGPLIGVERVVELDPDLEPACAADGNVLEENLPKLHDVIPAQTARIMVDLMQEPVRGVGGTAAKAQELKRPVAGKTGTTNDFTDAWFIGYTPSLVAGVWIGFDEKVTLGDKETGGKAALPAWIELMQQVYKDKPVEQFETNPVLTTAAPETAPAAIDVVSSQPAPQIKK